MSSFRFVHAADLHLGAPLSGIARADRDLAERFASASRDAFSDLVSRTIELGAALFVISGDVYDGEWRDASIGLFFARELGRLDRAGVKVAMVKGNHDADSVVTRAITAPESVAQFPSKKPATVRLDELKVALHGQSFADRAAPDNLARGYPAPVPGWFNIGLLHTSCGGYAAHETYAPCSVEELRLKGYDYWALGHVHMHEELSQDPWIVFPGCMQGRSVRECGPKGAVVVDVEDGRVVSAERLLVDRARFAIAEVDLADVADEASALRRIEEAAAPHVAEAEGRLLAVRVTLHGETPLHLPFAAARGRIAEEAQAALHRLGADVWLEKLKLATSSPAAAAERAPELKSLDLAGLMEGIDDDPEFLARAAETLQAMGARLPAASSDEPALADDLAGLLAEARALALGRLGA
ncbi:metallophosphoesterase family protein [Chenggangzhangella methanolivorans]|uniref:DNA repair exonuclease n=1 Tax=Chenggangzhangella methanolivorans TaxID=1437009 RepID=A0A9E6RGV4_9HYPH|nr:DNA repair exonuclease [Chenggangzhangella methanolivorans]QZO00787.1 DNA repair exonuclease [Chenggangzhangella methanolivorans]